MSVNKNNDGKFALILWGIIVVGILCALLYWALIANVVHPFMANIAALSIEAGVHWSLDYATEIQQ